MQLVLALLLLGAWEWSARRDITFQFFVSRPSKIADKLWQWITAGDLHIHAFHTTLETVAGFLLGVVAGLILALVCFYSPLVYRVIQPAVDVANAMPRAVFGPLFILWFGLGLTSKAMLAASLVLFIVFFGTLSGLQEVEENVLHKVRLMGASRLDLLLHVQLPSALVWVFSSLRSSVGFALAGAVIGEYMGAGRGVGFQIALSQGNLDSTGVFAGLLVLSMMVLVMNGLLRRVERLLTPWRVS
jgi:NitT/TauT family transport system permease protein